MNMLGRLKAALAPAPRPSPAAWFPRLRDGRALLIDVREPDEWADGVAEGALLLPLSDLLGARARWGAPLAEAKGRELVLYCKSGMRSGRAARLIRAEGFRATNAGSLADWAAAGWRIEKGGA